MLSVPAHLWIGEPEIVHTHIISLLQDILCAKNGCKKCRTCTIIAKEEHYSIRWIRPEKQYTRDFLAPLFDQLSFMLDVHERFFFILEDADFMSAACANSLLKSLEEPPQGYYFFLSARQEHAILPTIRSRCIPHHISTEQKSTINHPLFDCFTILPFNDPFTFMQTLDQSAINQQETSILLNQLLGHWMSIAKKAVTENNKKQTTQAQKIITILSHAMAKPPMPGSSKIFWKYMYLQVESALP